MKRTNKLLSVIMIVALALSLAVPAFAADAQSDQYVIYQVFTGDYSDGKLSNIKWGASTSYNTDDPVPDSVLAELMGDGLTTDSLKAEAVAKYVDPSFVYTSGDATSYENLPNGYYLVKNGEDYVPGTGEAYTQFIVKVVNGTLSFSPKVGAPTVEKTPLAQSANIGDTVTFTLTANIPERISDYDTYFLEFQDILSAGLTYVADSVKVYAVKGNEKFLIPEKNLGLNNQYIVNDEQPLKVTFADLKKVGREPGENAPDGQLVAVTADYDIVVEYKAVLNGNAVVGSAGNPNTVKLEYSNNPNDDSHGTTVEKVVNVYTWEIPVFKYTLAGENEEALANVGFKLYDGETQVQVIMVNTDGGYYYQVCTLPGEGHPETHGHVGEMMTDANGNLVIKGLAAGTYTLKETTTPDGYNTCDDVSVVIGDDGVLTGAVDGKIKVLNLSGSVLPETGGIGTTIFYICGGLMVLAAVVVLVSKRRMSTAE